MTTDTQDKEFDPNNDPAKLARIGAHVTKRLNANPLVQQVEHPDAQLYVYQGFLSAKDCKTLIAKIDAALARLDDGTYGPPRCTKAPSNRAFAPVTVAI